jgi:HEAT repeat protein
VAGLASGNPIVREEAREALVAVGTPAVAPLVRALLDPDKRVRWEAAKALSFIHDPAAAPALVLALGDDHFGTRWLAAEGLIALGRDALEPLLRALLDPANAVWLGEGAHHVLHELQRRRRATWLTPVMRALREREPGMAVPPAALAALKALRACNCVERRL